MDKFETAVREQLQELNDRMSKGKGLWPHHGYIQDKEWDLMSGSVYALRQVLRDCE